MPEWRKLHVKIKDSEDVNDMPDDFTRYLWTMFIITLDKEGRGIFKASWIKSHALPLREDVSTDQVMQAMAYYAEREMIRVYSVDGRRYFDIPSWHEYQNTVREAPSTLPSYEEGTLELLASNSRGCHAPEKEKEKEKDTEKEKELAAKKTSPRTNRNDPRSKSPQILLFKEITKHFPKLDLYDKVIEVLGEHPNKPKAEACWREWLTRGYNSNSYEWLFEWYTMPSIPPRSRNGNKHSDEGGHYSPL